MNTRRARRTLASIGGVAVLMVTGQQVATAAGPAPTTTKLVISYSAVSATVAWTAPVIAPTGTVTFRVNGHKVGAVPLPSTDPTKPMALRVTLHYHVPNGATRKVNATYGGDNAFAASTKTVFRHDPSISVKITSKVHKTKYGWYRTPVTLTWHCVAHGSPTDCPRPTHLTTSGGDQTTVARIFAHNGGKATIIVRHINIDRRRPALAVKRSGTHLTCIAKDGISGIVSCKIHRYTKNGDMHYRAVATDKAGNRRVVTGRI